MAKATARRTTTRGLVEVRAGRELHVEVMHPREEQQGQSPREGTAVFVQHGSMASCAQFTDVLQRLAEAEGMDDVTVVAWDSLGCGQSPKPEDDWDAFHTNELLADFEALIRRHRRARNFLVGHSHGSSQALRLGARHAREMAERTARTASGEEGDTNNDEEGEEEQGPQYDHHLFPPGLELSGVVLLGTALDLPQLSTLRNMFLLPVWLLNLFRESMRDSFLNMAFSEHTRLNKAELMESARSLNGDNSLAVAQAFYRQFLWISPEELEVLCDSTNGPGLRFLLIQGEEDAVTPPELAERLCARLADAGRHKVEMHRIPLTSHQVMQEEPERVCELLRDFVV